ncbi:MAG: hypothetical protein K2X27_23160 [Candidatus Obscuribacterales bacterium]|nr:hypothetical protein [Candidatus Obscuribacterales bacterium]
MTRELSEAIGQLIVGKVPGTELDEDTKECLKSGTICGITLFKENAQSAEQLIDLCDSVRKLSWHPAFIAVDQEGGAVQRLDHIISPLPSMMALGKLNDIERLKMLISLSGRQLRLLGINCVLAPVLDINTNAANPIIGTRSFGENPEKVARLGAAVIRAYLDSGILPVAKHFPGHGDTDMDSHLELPRLSHSLERLESIELFPFEENLLTTPAILIAHLQIACLDQAEVLPATLSLKVIKNLLREKMGYQHLLVSDDMLMKAITNKWGLEEACVRAVEAGLDLLLVCAGAEESRKVHAALVKAVENGRIPEERIREAIRAKLAALKRLPLFDEIDRSRRLSILAKSMAAADHLLMETSESAIEVSRGEPLNIFKNNAPIDIFVPEHPRYPLKFAEALRAENPSLTNRLKEHRYSVSVNPDEIEQAKTLSLENCVFVSFRATINRNQIELAKALKLNSKERLLVASDIPYDLNLIDWDNAVACFDPSDLAVKAFARAMNKRTTACKHCGQA